MIGKEAWPHLGLVARCILVMLYPLFVLAWASIWIVCGVPDGVRQRRADQRPNS